MLDAIAGRLTAMEFLAVLVSEVDEATRNQAEDSSTGVVKDECIRIQSYIDARYKTYRESLPATDARPETVIHAEWAVPHLLNILISTVTYD